MTLPFDDERRLVRSRQIDAACDVFEAAWIDGQTPCLEDVLKQVCPEDRDAWLEELLPLELFHRRKRGERVLAEEIVRRFPSASFAAACSILRRSGETDHSPSTAIDDVDGLSSTTAGPPGYAMLGELGRGAMGIVYRARHQRLARDVALKMMLSVSPDSFRRFQSEAQAIARLQHPNIVQIYDVGEHLERPFLALELVDGGTLGQKTAGVPQAPRDAARLVETLARAIHEAHRAGIVHRDLKPANVLLTRDGAPKISDFGLAKDLQGEQGATASGQLMGTPQYMAPEQASSQSDRIGPATDVYALGAILYEALTGRPPFLAADLRRLLQAICEQEPVAPRRIKHSVPRDLETICLKCLAKSPEARYATAAELADDLHRFLCDVSILARPESKLAKAWRWCRREPAIAVPTAALTLLLVSSTIAATIAARYFERISRDAQTSRKEAEDANEESLRSNWQQRLTTAREYVAVARMLRRSERIGQHWQALARLQDAHRIFQEAERAGIEVADERDWSELRSEAASVLLVPDLRITQRWPRSKTDLPDYGRAIPGDRYLRLSRGDDRAEICRLGDDEPIDHIDAPPGRTFVSMSFSERRDRVALLSNLRSSAADGGLQLHLFDIGDRPRLLRTLPRQSTEAFYTISNDGRMLALNQDAHSTRVERVDDGTLVAQTELGLAIWGYPWHPKRPWLALQRDDRICVFDHAENRLVWERKLRSEASYAAWSHDGRSLFISTSDALYTMDGDTGAEWGEPVSSHDSEGIVPMSLSRDGMIASTDWSGSLRLFQVGSGRLQLKTKMGLFDFAIWEGESSPRTFAFDDRDFVTWEARGGRMREFATQATDHFALNHAGDVLAVSRRNRGCFLYHLPTGEQLNSAPLSEGDLPLGFSADDRNLFVYGQQGLRTVRLTPLDSALDRWEFASDHSQLSIDDSTRDRWGMDRRGLTIARPAYSQGGLIYHLPHVPGYPATVVYTARQEDVRSAAVSPDGRWVVFGSHVRGKIAVYSSYDGALVRELTEDAGTPKFSPDGRWLMVSKFTGGGELFQVEGWKSHGTYSGGAAAMTCDGNLLALEEGESTVRFLATDTLREIGRLEIQDQARVFPLDFTPDNRGLIAATAENRRLIFIDLAGVRHDLQKLGLDWDWPTTISPPQPPPLAPFFRQGPPKPSAVAVPAAESLENWVRNAATDRRWDEVARLLEQLVAARPNDRLRWYQLALVQAYRRNGQGYARAVAELLRRSRDSRDLTIQVRLASVAGLRNSGTIASDLPPQMVEGLLRHSAEGIEESWRLTACGLLDLRRGRPKEAEEQFQKALVQVAEHRDIQSLLHFAAAVARTKQGKLEKAKASYALGLDPFWNHLPHRPEHAPLPDWDHLLMIEMFCREAEIAIWGHEFTIEERQQHVEADLSANPPPRPLWPVADKPIDGRRVRKDETRVLVPFEWQPVEGAESYHLAVFGERQDQTLLDMFVDRSGLAATRYVVVDRDDRLVGGEWRVRAKVQGRWTKWSSMQTFKIAPLDVAAPRPTPSAEHVEWSPGNARGLELVGANENKIGESTDAGAPDSISILPSVHLRIDDSFARDLSVDDPHEYWIEVSYQSPGPLPHQLFYTIWAEYDGHPLDAAHVDTPFRSTTAIARPLDGGRYDVTFELPQARFANRLPHASDFRLASVSPLPLQLLKVTLHKRKSR